MDTNMENTENTESAGTVLEQEFTLKGQVEYEIKFTKEGLELTYSPKSDITRLLALLIAQEASEDAKSNLQAFCKGNPKNKWALDRLDWAGRTAKGTKILADSYIEIVIHDNANKKVPAEIEPANPTEEEKEIITKEIKLEAITTVQNTPTEE